MTYVYSRLRRLRSSLILLREKRGVGGGREEKIYQMINYLRYPTDAPIAVLTHRPVTLVSRTQTRATSMKISNYIDVISGIARSEDNKKYLSLRIPT